MPDTDSWIIKAIEQEAMSRAHMQLTQTSTFRFMGYAPEQMAVIMGHVLSQTQITPMMSVQQIQERLRARYR